jgi:hypothetical protein
VSSPASRPTPAVEIVEVHTGFVLGLAVAREAIAAERETFVEAGVELAAEFAGSLVLLGGFDFVEAALVGLSTRRRKT